MATIKNEKYQVYANYLVKDVPIENLKILVTAFLDHAALNMGANVEKANVDRVVEIITEDYSVLPINQVASAFVKGSMGYFGEGNSRLIPKSINNWLREIRLDYDRYQDHKKREDVLNNPAMSFDALQKFPLGKAIIKKIDWYKAGAMDSNDWDNIDLKVLAEMIGLGQHPTLEDFNVINKNQ